MDIGIVTLLNGIAKAEGHGNPLTYDTVFAYGKFGSPYAPLSSLALTGVYDFQSRMLSNQKGRVLKSTAVGRYQFIKKTLQKCQKAYRYPSSKIFSPLTQDQFACYLLHIRGFDDWRDGKISRTTFQNNLAKEWASIPTTKGKSYYGQGVGISQKELSSILDIAFANRNSIETPELPTTPTPSYEGPVVRHDSWLERIWRWIFGG